MLGAICYQTARNVEAFDLILRALDLTEWQFSMMRYNLGLVIVQLERQARDGTLAIDEQGLVAIQEAEQRLVRPTLDLERFLIQANEEPFKIPATGDPVTSIVIPAYGQYELTRSCLKSIADHTDAGKYEVVLVDDAFPEPASMALANVSGLRIIRNDTNLGFIGSCNHGARTACGRYIVFLHNDTLVTPRWLDSLLDVLKDPSVGLVGAKLVYPDGRLQEAGCIIWRDAIPAQWGRNDDPGKPEYNYVRDVDYCSGACIALQREEFLAVGGFDTLFAPAYFEDADLAMRLTSIGKRVVYQPAATVIHFEGVSSQTDVSQGVKRYQAINYARFQERWLGSCVRRRACGDQPHLEKDRKCGARVLMIDAYIPRSDQDSGSVRVTAAIGLLVELRCKVTFLASNLEHGAEYGEALRQRGIEVLHQPYVWSIEQLLEHRGKEFDLVIVSRYHVAQPILAAIRAHAPQAILVLDTVDLHHWREWREAELGSAAADYRRALLTRAAELDCVREADVTLVVSEAERLLLQDAAPHSRVEVLSNIHEIRGCKNGFASRRDIFFVGGFRHAPNVDAVTWYTSKIWPLVRRYLPDVRTYFIGSNMPAKVRRLEGNGISAVGHVAELDSYLDGCRIAIAPLRFGAGVKGKINSALASGVPVVATEIAGEGMFLRHDENVLLADSPADFAAQLVRLYEDEALWNRLSRQGIAAAQAHFSPAAARDTLTNLLALSLSRDPGLTLPHSGKEAGASSTAGRSSLVLLPSSFGGLGDEAMVRGLLVQLNKEDARRGIDLLSIYGGQRWPKFPGVRRVIDLSPTRGRSHQNILDELLRKYDEFLLLGADVLDGGYSEAESLERLSVLKSAIAAGLSCKVLGFSFTTNPPASIVATLCEAAKECMLFPRDPRSLERLEQHGLLNLHQCADLAFLMEPASGPSITTRTSDPWVKEQHAKGRTIVAFSWSSQVHAMVQAVQPGTDVIGQLADFLARLASERAVSVIIMPHDIRETSSKSVDDIAVALAIGRKMTDRLGHQRHHQAVIVADAPEAKRLAGMADLVITGRMHFAIAALGMGKPVVAIGYQDQFDGLMELFGLGNAVVSAANFSCDQLGALTNRVLDDLDAATALVMARLPGVLALSRRPWADNLGG